MKLAEERDSWARGEEMSGQAALYNTSHIFIDETRTSYSALGLCNLDDGRYWTAKRRIGNEGIQSFAERKQITML